MSSTEASKWVCRNLPLLQPGGLVLDLACGKGRHTRLLLDRGFQVCAVDIDLQGINDLADHPQLELMQYDLEGQTWPFPANYFAGIIVCNYLHRPLFPVLANSLAPDGPLLYETFALGNEAFGRPRNPKFLLRPGELHAVFNPLLQVLDFAEVTEQSAVRQRIVARRVV